jgi:hypothetical protein
MERIRIEQHSFMGTVWFGGRFTIGFLHLTFWLAVFAIVIWPYCGKAMQVEAILPNGTTQIISSVSNFDFRWMTNYIFAEDAAKGTVIHVTAWYDNTKANKNNPDPDLKAERS